MDRKILASEIEKEIKTAAQTIVAAAKPKWAELEYEEQYAVIRNLIKKYGLDKDYDPLKRRGISIWFKNGGKGQNQVEANVNWPSRGELSIEDAEKFAKGLSDAVVNLKKATEDLKKQYPEVKIVDFINY